MLALRWVPAGLVLALIGVAGPAAAQPDGLVIAVVQAASIDGSTGQMVLQPEAPIFSGDRITTDAGGEAQIRFRDDTKLVVGPNSAMVIDAFVFNADDTARDISINVLRGAFRFITGNSSKDAYTITTPTATIGVRGTEFDVAVESEGTTRVANFEGTTIICRRQPDGSVRDPASDCVEARDPCTLSVVRPTQSDVVRYSNDDLEFRNRQLRFFFPYVRDQGSLLTDFQVNVEQCLTAAALPPPGPIPPPGPVPPPVVVPPPVPGAPVAPVFDPPPAAVPDDTRHSDRPIYDHGPVFR